MINTLEDYTKTLSELEQFENQNEEIVKLYFRNKLDDMAKAYGRIASSRTYNNKGRSTISKALGKTKDWMSTLLTGKEINASNLKQAYFLVKSFMDGIPKEKLMEVEKSN